LFIQATVSAGSQSGILPEKSLKYSLCFSFKLSITLYISSFFAISHDFHTSQTCQFHTNFHILFNALVQDITSSILFASICIFSLFLVTFQILFLVSLCSFDQDLILSCHHLLLASLIIVFLAVFDNIFVNHATHQTTLAKIVSIVATSQFFFKEAISFILSYICQIFSVSKKFKIDKTGLSFDNSSSFIFDSSVHCNLYTI
jgi:hypothetical protein